MFVSCENLIQKYGKTINIIDYSRLVQAIPKDWEKIVRHKIVTEIAQPAKSLIKNDMKCTKKVYWFVLDNKKVSFPMKSKWEHMLNVEITDEAWNQWYLKQCH